MVHFRSDGKRTSRWETLLGSCIPGGGEYFECILSFYNIKRNSWMKISQCLLTFVSQTCMYIYSTEHKRRNSEDCTGHSFTCSYNNGDWSFHASKSMQKYHKIGPCNMRTVLFDFFKPYVYARNRLKFVLLFTENLLPHTAVKLYGSLLLQWKLPNKNVFYLFHWSKSRRGLKWHENE